MSSSPLSLLSLAAYFVPHAPSSLVLLFAMTALSLLEALCFMCSAHFPVSHLSDS